LVGLIFGTISQKLEALIQEIFFIKYLGFDGFSLPFLYVASELEIERKQSLRLLAVMVCLGNGKLNRMFIISLENFGHDSSWV